MEIVFTLRNGERILLRADEHNYELCRPRGRKDKGTGKIIEQWAGFKWYGSLSHALERIVDMKVRTSDVTSLKELAAVIVAAQEEVLAAWSMEIPAKRLSGVDRVAVGRDGNTVRAKEQYRRGGTVTSAGEGLGTV